MIRLTYEELFAPGGVLDEASTLTYDKLFRRSDPKRIWRSGQVRGPPLEIDAYKNAIFHTFNFKSFPSTTGKRHRGYIKFEKPSHGRPTPSEKLPVVVDCTCPDFRYRWAWANKQRGASRVGAQSLNQAHDRAPRITNPGNKIGLCKHLLAARNYIYGLIQKFDKDLPAANRGKQDIAWKLDQLVKYANKRWINWDKETADGLRRQQLQRQVQQARNIAGPMPAAEVPPNIDNEMPVPLPAPDIVPDDQADIGDEFNDVPPAQPQNQPQQQRNRPPQRGNRNREESRVVRTAANIVETMNKNLLKQTKALVEALGDDQDPMRKPHGEDHELAAEVADAALGGAGEGAPGGEGAALPPPPTDELGGDMPPGEMGVEGGLEGGAPEDEALGLLRDIAGGIDRLANELAPVEAPEGGLPGEEGGEGAEPGEGGPMEPKGGDDDDDDKKKKKGDEPGVPPVEDDDEFNETMPVASGA